MSRTTGTTRRTTRAKAAPEQTVAEKTATVAEKTKPVKAESIAAEDRPVKAEQKKSVQTNIFENCKNCTHSHACHYDCKTLCKHAGTDVCEKECRINNAKANVFKFVCGSFAEM